MQVVRLVVAIVAALFVMGAPRVLIQCANEGNTRKLIVGIIVNVVVALIGIHCVRSLIRHGRRGWDDGLRDYRDDESELPRWQKRR